MTTIGGITQHGVFDTASAVGGGSPKPSVMPQPTGPLPWFANDAAARAGGVADWGFYLNSAGVQQLQGS